MLFVFKFSFVGLFEICSDALVTYIMCLVLYFNDVHTSFCWEHTGVYKGFFVFKKEISSKLLEWNQ